MAWLQHLRTASLQKQKPRRPRLLFFCVAPHVIRRVVDIPRLPLYSSANALTAHLREQIILAARQATLVALS
jgi:hypothetical protein